MLMPARSVKQRNLMGAALNCKRTGKCGNSEVKKVAKSMSENDLRDFAGTKTKGLPKRVKK